MNEILFIFNTYIKITFVQKYIFQEIPARYIGILFKVLFRYRVILLTKAVIWA